MNKFAQFANLILSGRNEPPQPHAELYAIAKMLDASYFAGGTSYLLPAGASVGAEVKAQIAKFDKYAAEKLMPSNLGGPFDLP